MKKQTFNLKGLGLKQNRILFKMAKENLVIKVINSDYGNKTEIILCDDGCDNVYEDVPEKLFVSLGKRKLFKSFGWMPALSVTIDTFSLKHDVKRLFDMGSITENAQ